jgi:hypothetical protein
MVEAIKVAGHCGLVPAQGIDLHIVLAALHFILLYNKLPAVKEAEESRYGSVE